MTKYHVRRTVFFLNSNNLNNNTMVNQIYRIPLHGGREDSKLDFWVCGTNELNPYRQTKELAVVVIGEPQLDAMLDLESIDSLIKYLTDCREFIKNFNDNSKPEPNE